MIVRIQEHHAVIAVEGAEEGYPQDAGIIGKLGLPLGFLGLAVLYAAVEHLHLSVLAEGVVRLRELDTALEAVVETGDLVPVAQVSFELKVAGDRVVNGSLGAAARAKQDAHGQNG